MDVPSSLTRSVTKVPLSASLDPTNRRATILAAQCAAALALQLGSAYHVGTLSLTFAVLGVSAAIATTTLAAKRQLAKFRHVQWSTLAVSSFFLLGQQTALFVALRKTSTIRVLVFALLAPVWPQVFTTLTSIRRTLVLLVALLTALIFAPTSTHSSNYSSHLFAAFGLLGHAISTCGVEHTKGVLTSSHGSSFAANATVIGGFILSVPIYLFRAAVIEHQNTPYISYTAYLGVLALSLSLLYLTPLTHSSHPVSTYLPTVAFVAVSEYLIFGHYPSAVDAVIAFLLSYGSSQSSQEGRGSGAPSFKALRVHLKTITSNPESRKIFYFLLLNMVYMGVQMLYGVWTNSLGLISDAIHMAFDCMAIGVGLFASVMATWPPNERFTYGYARIETLSGFANGIFLILISIFIVFEAIQRILHPPEMNTSQLLLVSSIGLGVNLFGMFAMGGHHHHGHSHSHGHGHGHSHGHSHVAPAIKHDHSHGGHSHSPVHENSISHSRSHSHSPSHGHDDRHSHGHEEPHTHSHSHTHGLDEHHSHSPEEHHSHGHSHDLSHSHSHSHSSDPSSSPKIQHRRSNSSQTIVIPNHSVKANSGLDDTPITPAYSFGFDSHYESHHSQSGPNVHDHTHGHGHGEGHSDNMRGVFLHVMADTLGSVGVIISTLLIQYYGWTGFDPIASLFIAILIAASVIPLVVDTGKILCLDVSSKDASVREALNALNEIEGLASYTMARFWPKDSSSIIGSIHIRLAVSAASVDPGGPHQSEKTTFTRMDRVVRKVDECLRNRIPGLEELTIQVDK